MGEPLSYSQDKMAFCNLYYGFITKGIWEKGGSVWDNLLFPSAEE